MLLADLRSASAWAAVLARGDDPPEPPAWPSVPLWLGVGGQVLLWLGAGGQVRWCGGFLRLVLPDGPASWPTLASCCGLGYALGLNFGFLTGLLLPGSGRGGPASWGLSRRPGATCASGLRSPARRR